jgi:hypothetical protein
VLGAFMDSIRQSSLESIERDKLTQGKLGCMRTGLGEVNVRSNNLGEPYLSNIKETTPQILYTLWNFSVRNSNADLLYSVYIMYH